MKSILKKLRKKLTGQGVKSSSHTPEIHPDGLSRDQVFSKIYKDNVWGKKQRGDSAFYSGDGSHEPQTVNTYVAAIRDFLDSIGPPRDLVDLGCGDFNIGSQIAQSGKSYLGCDIVPDLISHNMATFGTDTLGFRVLDIVDDPLPKADVIFIRQVLQHLSNADIQKFCDKIVGSCEYLVVTEHLPKNPKFVPNLDQGHGAGIRLDDGSGVVLTAPPFRFSPRSQKVLCEVFAFGGVIRTTAYEMEPAETQA